MTQRTKKLYLQQKKRYLKKIVGNIEKPRLAVFRSHKHIYAQLIDDTNSKTLAYSSTLDKEISKKIEKSNNQASSFLVGIDLAEKAIKKEISVIVFDRGSKPYHGRIKSLAEGARKQGLIF
jgi:large subunit ribosomal protein L18